MPSPPHRPAPYVLPAPQTGVLCVLPTDVLFDPCPDRRRQVSTEPEPDRTSPSLDSAAASPADPAAKKKKSRCDVCRKKVGLTGEWLDRVAAASRDAGDSPVEAGWSWMGVENTRLV